MASRQPHIYGAAPLHYRQGTAVATAETPPVWAPEKAADPNFPYTLTEYIKDEYNYYVPFDSLYDVLKTILNEIQVRG